MLLQIEKFKKMYKLRDMEVIKLAANHRIILDAYTPASNTVFVRFDKAEMDAFKENFKQALTSYSKQS